jgi:3'-phosphoadenosine 5'-phosphosulfate sulfotransferase (PAPS reductase)/FAD synthetase
MDAKKWYYLEKNNVPQNTLHKQGFVVLAVHDTRAISEDEDIRAGRWWWESSHKECGLHQNKLLSTKLENSNKLKT